MNGDPRPSSALGIDRAWLAFASLILVCGTVTVGIELATRPDPCQPQATFYPRKEKEPIGRFGNHDWTWHAGIVSRPGTTIVYLGESSLRIEAPKGGR